MVSYLKDSEIGIIAGGSGTLVPAYVGRVTFISDRRQLGYGRAINMGTLLAIYRGYWFGVG